jgi:hypothetical protein
MAFIQAVKYDRMVPAFDKLFGYDTADVPGATCNKDPHDIK